MSRHETTLEKIVSRPTPPDIKWSDLTKLLKYLGYEKVKSGRTSGSRRKFYHKEKDVLICCHQPHPSSVLGRKCVRDIADHLKSNGFVKK